MELRIGKNGFLQIKRKNQWKEQGCPYDEGAKCGDWCAKFGEPLIEKETFGKYFLDICDCKRIFSENHIEDLRE